ncbi:MAG: PD40 domain-containing protein [Acidobacteria bacterium]|nr:PD40 domain-containing protein [Acidobacteriota bacterium]
MRARWAIVVGLVAACGAWSGAQTGRDVRLTLTEGTSMAAALSPDGRTIALDLLGALWTVGIDGGRATRVLDDGYDAHEPAWSPDGARLAFQAYYRDTWNIWTMKADGSDLRQVTSGPFDDREPHWAPDGRSLAFSSDRGGNYDVWLLTLASGDVRRLTTGGSNESMPAWSPDGKEVAFVSHREPKGIYARTVATGVDRQLAADTATLHRPSWSPDGRTIAYVAVDGPVARLMAGGRNVAAAGEDVHPFRPSWVSATELLYTADGGVRRRALAGGDARRVPFAAEIAFTRDAFTPAHHAFPLQGPQPVLGLMHPSISPDGATIVFGALGDLWLLSTREGDGVPRRLTHDVHVETNPVWAPDGASIAYSSDRDGSVGLWVHDMKTGAGRRLAADATTAAWSPDGTRMAYLDAESKLHMVRVANREHYQVHDRLFEPGRPSFSPDGRAVVLSALKPYSTRFREGTNQVLRVAVEPDTTPEGKGAYAADLWMDPIPHKSVGMRENLGPVWSPNGREMVAIVDGQLTTYPVARDGTPAGPPRRISTELASSPSWTADSRRVLYQAAGGFRLADLVDGSIRAVTPQWTWTAKTTTATTTIHAGRLFDAVAGAALRTGVDIVIEGNRIVSVAPHGDGGHRGTVVDASDSTVLPGLIESHTHLGKSEAQGRTWLAFGITTVRNPATNAFEGQEEREAIESGVRVGPRVVTTGEPLDGSRIYYPGGVALDGGGLVDAHMARARAMRYDFVKTYVRLPDLLQKRGIAAAHAAGMPVTSHEIYPAVAYGADGVEHVRGTSRRGYSPKNSELCRSYADVVQLLTATGMTLTPTITIQGGFQVLTAHDPWWTTDSRLALFPASVAARGTAMRARPLAGAELGALEALVTPQEKLVLDVVRGGGRVIAGTDSPINPPGVALLSEIEHYVRGGLSPAEAIRTATAVPASAFGLGGDLGTIEVGKLADLVIVDGNPLQAITDLRRTRRVVKDGVVYDLERLLAGPITP